MENKDSLSCQCCGHGEMMHNNKHYLLKKFFMLVLVIIVFCFGVQLGEIKAELRYSGFGHGGMMGWNRGFDNNDNYGYGMMGWVRPDTSAAKPATTTPAAKQ